MAITFTVKAASYKDNLTDTDLAAAIKATLDACNATTVYTIQIERYYGQIHVIMAYA